jgi:hypothetical protein
MLTRQDAHLASNFTPLTRSPIMNTVPQTPATRERLTDLVAELFGDQPTPVPQASAGNSTVSERWQDAVTQIGEQLPVQPNMCSETVTEYLSIHVESTC